MIIKFINCSFNLRLMSVAGRTKIIIFLCVFIFGLSRIGEAQGDEDSASVYEFVKAYQRTLNTRNPVALGAFFTDDADLMMFNLPGVHGRQEIENWWKDVWQSKFNRQESGRKGTMNLKSVRFISDDVALVNIETKTRGRDSSGVEIPVRKARGTWLLIRNNTNWLISAMRGMPTVQDSVVLGASNETANTLKPHIRVIVEAFEDSFNSHDPTAVSAFFREDADIIVRNSPLIQGRKSIQDWWGNYFAKPRNYKALFIIDEIRTINDDVVQLNFTVTGAIPGTENELQPLRQTRAMWILVRDAGEWHIAALRVLPSEEDRVIRRSDH